MPLWSLFTEHCELIQIFCFFLCSTWVCYVGIDACVCVLCVWNSYSCVCVNKKTWNVNFCILPAVHAPRKIPTPFISLKKISTETIDRPIGNFRECSLSTRWLATAHGISRVVDGEDLDGVPMDKVKPARAATFIPSKWETVDENEDSAVTSSKWDDVEQSESKDDSNSKGTGLTSSRRGDLSSERIQGDSGEDDSVSLDDRWVTWLTFFFITFLIL